MFLNRFVKILVFLIYIIVLALQRHYGVLQAIALDEDEMPEVKDETLPDEEGLARCHICLTLFLMK